MLRTLGACLIACAAAGTGFVCAAQSKRRIHALETAVQAVELLKVAVVLQLQPLEEALAALQSRNLLLAVLHREKLPCAVETLRKCGLSKEEAEIFLTLLHAIPSAAAGQDSHFTVAAQQLNQCLSTQRAAAKQATLLYPKLGLLGGLAAFLMLI